MSKRIGLIDYDVMFTRKYEAPNYDIGVTYAYFKEDKNYSVRLVAIATPKELAQYDEIYIYKTSKYLPHPSYIIKDYYKLPVKEFGLGFANRELRPLITETLHTMPDFTCYNTILRFSIENPRHPKAWKLKPLANYKKYQHLRLYENIDGEYLRKDIPNFRSKNLIIYDDLNVLFNDAAQVNYLKEILPKITHLCFANQLDISLLNDTNILEWIISNKKFSSIKKRLFASSINENVLWLADHLIRKQYGTINIKVLLLKEQSQTYYLTTLLYMNYLNNKTNYTMRMRPYSDEMSLNNYPLVTSAFRFLYEKPFLMSFYEYLFYVGCKTIGVPVDLVRTNEDTYEYIMSRYGMPRIVQDIEDWLTLHPENEEFIFIGGSSNYEQIRRKYYESRRSKIAFGQRN